MDRGVIATASELFDARHYPGVLAMCADALEDEPECVPLLLIRARAHVALRRDLDAQADLRDVIRLDPRCALAYRVLGELAARHDENAAAAQFFREALRLDPDDREAHDWLLIVDEQRETKRGDGRAGGAGGNAPRGINAPVRPAAGAAKLPAPAPAAGRFSSSRAAELRGTPRLARGTEPPDQPDERPTRPFARSLPAMAISPSRDPREHDDLEPPTLAHGTGRQAEARRNPTSYPAVRLVLPRADAAAAPPRSTGAVGARDLASVVEPTTAPTLRGCPPLQRPAKDAPRLKPTARGPVPELPGFDEYLVANGILTRDRLRAAQAYQRSMKVQLSTAIVTLGLVTPQRIEWAAVAHQSQVARDRRGP